MESERETERRAFKEPISLWDPEFVGCLERWAVGNVWKLQLGGKRNKKEENKEKGYNMGLGRALSSWIALERSGRNTVENWIEV